MFFGEERLPHVVKMILAAARGQRGIDLAQRLKERLKEAKGGQAAEIKKELAKVEKEYGRYVKDYKTALKKLEPMQKADFAGLFKEMHGSPVTIRTLDPPLHEFLPKREELMVEIATLKARGGSKNKRTIETKEKLLRAVEELHEFNPMLGHRGCRLGITYPEITRMQARAIFEAALAVAKKGIPVKPEVMIPLVGHVEELKRQKAIVLEAANEVLGKDGSGVDYLIGTMIEVPRGAMTADEIAKEARVLLLRHQRPDADGLRPEPRRRGEVPALLPGARTHREGPVRDDRRGGRGAAREDGRPEGAASVKKDLKIGVCGEHGGDPASIRFFHEVGLDYVSCSPYRVPIARLAAAQAQLEQSASD